MNDTKNYLPVGRTGNTQIISRRKKKIFLQCLRRTGQVNEASRLAGYTDSGVMRLYRTNDPEFARQWDLALEAAADVLEDEAIRRAVNGVDKPVFYKGQVVGYENARSDQLLMFLLRGSRPDKFGDRVNVEGTIKGTFGVAVLPMTAVSSIAWEGAAAAHAAALPAPQVNTSGGTIIDQTPIASVISTEVKRG